MLYIVPTPIGNNLKKSRFYFLLFEQKILKIIKNYYKIKNILKSYHSYNL
ncbi:MAG: hypothetical protein ACKA36_00150 [Candidatus Karelsulcia muelleri]